MQKYGCLLTNLATVMILLASCCIATYFTLILVDPPIRVGETVYSLNPFPAPTLDLSMPTQVALPTVKSNPTPGVASTLVVNTPPPTLAQATTPAPVVPASETPTNSNTPESPTPLIGASTEAPSQTAENTASPDQTTAPAQTLTLPVVSTNANLTPDSGVTAAPSNTPAETATQVIAGPSLTLTFSAYPMVVQSIQYRAYAQGCNFNGVAGEVLDENGQHLVGDFIQVKGNGLDTKAISGSKPDYAPSGFEIKLGDQAQDTTQVFSIQVLTQANEALTELLRFDTHSVCQENLLYFVFKRVR